MVSFITSAKAQKKLAENMRALRLHKGLTQEGLSQRSGVSLATLRKFEQKGAISLESLLKLAMVLDVIDKLVAAVEAPEETFSSIDDVLDEKNRKTPQRGWRK